MEKINDFGTCFDSVFTRKEKENVAFFDEIGEVIFDAMVENNLLSDKIIFSNYGFSKTTKINNQNVLMIKFITETENCGVSGTKGYVATINKQGEVSIVEVVDWNKKSKYATLLKIEDETKQNIENCVKDYIVNNFENKKIEEIELGL